MDQLIEDAAVRRIPRIATLFTQRLELFLELAQFADAGRNMRERTRTAPLRPKPRGLGESWKLRWKGARGWAGETAREAQAVIGGRNIREGNTLSK